MRVVDVRPFLREANGGETQQMTPAQLTAFVASEQAKILPVLEKAMKTDP